MTKRRRQLVGRVGLVLMSLVAAVIGICIGAAIVVGIIQLYGSV